MLLEELLKRNLINEEVLSSTLLEMKSSNLSEEKAILKKELMSSEKLLSLKSELLETPVFENVLELQIQDEVLAIIPEESAKYYQMVPTLAL